MAQGYEGEIPFAELCYRIYQGFGQYAVANFVSDRQREDFLKDITWGYCEPCEFGDTPFENNDCLVCGTRKAS